LNLYSAALFAIHNSKSPSTDTKSMFVSQR
jgi:hypothetical protein